MRKTGKNVMTQHVFVYMSFKYSYEPKNAAPYIPSPITQIEVLEKKLNHDEAPTTGSLFNFGIINLTIKVNLYGK